MSLKLVPLVVLLLCQSAAAESPRFLYQGWLGDREIYVIAPPSEGAKSAVTFGGDAIFEHEFCDDCDSFVCVFARDISFAVPRIIGKQDEWEFKGHKFEVAERNIRQRLFGREISGLLLIRTPPKAEFHWEPGTSQNYYLYSPASGLLAFSWSRASGASVVFWSQAPVGFGSVSD